MKCVERNYILNYKICVRKRVRDFNHAIVEWLTYWSGGLLKREDDLTLVVESFDSLFF